MAQFGTQISHNFNFFLHVVRIPAITLVFLLRKRKEIVKVIHCLFRETSTASAQVVAASNSVEEGSSLMLLYKHIAILSDLKTMLQHILDNVVI